MARKVWASPILTASPMALQPSSAIHGVVGLLQVVRSVPEPVAYPALAGPLRWPLQNVSGLQTRCSLAQIEHAVCLRPGGGVLRFAWPRRRARDSETTLLSGPVLQGTGQLAPSPPIAGHCHAGR